MMYEKYVLCPDSLKNVAKDGAITGFCLQSRIPYYRGVPLSMVEDISVVVDGKKYDADLIRFTVSGGTFSLAEMPTLTFFRWEFGEKATIEVTCPGGLAPESHQVEVMIMLRISYMPWRGYTRAWAEMKPLEA